jgi:hypothetical protein
MRAIKELSATASRDGYDTTSIITLKKVDEQLRKLYKECISLSNEEIEEELKKEGSTNYKSANNDWPAKDSNVLAATNQDASTSEDDDNEWEDITPEGVIYRLTALTNDIRQVIGPDLENTDYNKPNQEDFPTIDWTTIDRPIDPLDKEYGT